MLDVVKARPCVVIEKGTETPAYFHIWAPYSEIVPPSLLRGGHSGGTVADVFAVVELLDGQVRFVTPTKIKFTDREGREC